MVCMGCCVHGHALRGLLRAGVTACMGCGRYGSVRSAMRRGGVKRVPILNVTCAPSKACMGNGVHRSTRVWVKAGWGGQR